MEEEIKKETKICTKCELEKELPLFTHVRKVNKLGESYIYYNPVCRKCKNKAQNDYLKLPENAEKRKNKINKQSRNRTNRMMNDAEYAERITKRNQVWRDKNRDKINDYYKKNKSQRKSHLKNTYGITLEQFDEIVSSQNNRCPICDNPTIEFAVDHCHRTGDIRGIICNYCNSGLGYFKDDIKALEGAIRYLQKEPMIKNID
jgi:hypothetical protein